MSEGANTAESQLLNLARIEVEGNFKTALYLMEHTNKNLFITGKAGTGKSTLLEYFQSTTRKNAAVLAPTGVAALNIRGQTIHSFFGFKPDITIDAVRKLSQRRSELYRNMNMIIIDEVSMVRADLLDCIDAFMRFNGRDRSLPFGGSQMVFIGDLYQLPPIVQYKEKKMFREHYRSEYFFDALAFKNFKAEFIELDKHYRQKDMNFIELLNSVRNNTTTEAQIMALNKRFNPSFNPGVFDGYITLTPTNALADEINYTNLRKLKGGEYTYKARVEGDFDTSAMPAEEVLSIKPETQVMLLNNDRYDRWVNGSMGNIISIKHDSDKEDLINVILSDGSEVEVAPHTWELFHFSYDASLQKLVPEVVGTFTQYPMMLAWAITIHKSQGKTFEKMILDLGRGTFANGQLYVALSRCKTLSGIVLRKRLEKKHILTDWRIVRFLTRYQYGKSDERIPLREKVRIIREAIKEKKKLEITYLKQNDEKSNRIVSPSKVGEFDYLGKSYLGMEGFDSKRQERRSFRVERILEIKTID